MLAQLTAHRDEQRALLLSCLAFGRTLLHGVHLVGRPLDGYGQERAHILHFVTSTQSRFARQTTTKTAKINHNTSVPIFRSRVFNLTFSYEYGHEFGAAGASPLTSRPSRRLPVVGRGASASSPATNRFSIPT